jgi:Glutaminase
MPKEKIFLGKFRNPSPLKDIVAARTPEEKRKPVKITFETGREALLDLSYPRAEVWAKMIDHLEKNNRPVYVEIDPDTDMIIKLYMPQAARVFQIQPSGEEIVYVTFHTSHARHYLRRNHPNFQQMLDALQAAKDDNTVVLVTATFPEFEIIDVRPLPPSFGKEDPPGPPPPPVPDPPVTWSRAVDLFNMMNAQTCTPCSAAGHSCIPFKLPYDGCWIRAHLMCYSMIAEGETPEKVWIDGILHALSSNVPECGVDWGWHVAPTLMVIQSSGPDLKMVIDPSLCTEPVTPEDWKALQGDPAATLTYTGWGQYQHGIPSSTGTQAQANTDMEDYRLWLDQICTDYGSSPYECPIVKRCYFIIDRSTISKDEVDAMLHIGSPAVIDAAFYFVVDGFTPQELGITNGTLVGIPNIQPTFTINPAIAQMTVDLMPNLGLEDPVHLIRRQKITWKYKISFTGSGGFVNDLQELDLSASITSVVNPIVTVSATSKIYLIKKPNPYEVDGQTSWLSTDLRVFQIKTGESRFNKTMATDASDFIKSVINNLNNGTAGQPFETISVDQQTSWLELSNTVGGTNVYNFAIAKVRYRSLTILAQDVRVFFRLFPASSTSLEYDQATTYRRYTQGNIVRALPGIINGELVTIPCFADPRIDSSTVQMIQQPDPANIIPIPADSSGNEVTRFFGCWLDINQLQPQFPINPAPADGPYPAASRKTIQELVRNQHQCLVAEIAYDPTPIATPASPSTSDKLAQRNLAIVESANPGDIASHRIPHTFEIKPTRKNLEPGEQPDELMIDWGNTPVGSLATLYLPAVESNDILSFARKTYSSEILVRVDSHTLQCETGGITYIPIPPGEGSNYAGMISIDLPATVKKGQVFTIVVHQVTNAAARGREVREHGGIAITRGRKILGSFQLTIPVRAKEDMLVREERLLSNLRWIQKTIPGDNRWFPVFTRYVKQIANRVNALGGEAKNIIASPSDDWKKRARLCVTLDVAMGLLLTALVIIAGIVTGGMLVAVEAVVIVLLAIIIYYWMKICQPSVCKLLLTVLIAVGLGAVVLLILMLLGFSAPQLVGVLVGSAVITAVMALVCWRRGCF